MKKIVFFLFVLLVVVLCGRAIMAAETKETDTESAEGLSPEQSVAVLERMGLAKELPEGLQGENISQEVEGFVEWLKGKTAEGELELTQLPEQMQELYEKYGLTVVENANEAINEAVGDAVKSAAKGFFENLKDSISDLFKNIFS